MNLQRLRKVLVFAMVVLPIMAFSIEAEIGILPLALAWLALPVAWFWEPPRIRYDRWESFWTVMTLGLFAVLVAATVFGTMGVIFSVVYFVLFLAVARLFQRRSNREHIQTMGMSLVMIAAAGVFNDGLSFAFFFTFYAIIATMGLTVHHLHVEIGDHHGRDVASTRVDPRILWVTAVLAAIILVLALVFFLSFPRIGFGFFSLNERSGLQTSGFREDVELGSHGTIRTDSSIVMRIRFPDGPPEPPQGLYVRGMALETFDGRRWLFEADERIHHRRVDGGVLIGEPARRHWPAVGFEEAVADYSVAEVYLQPLDTNVLFGIGGPLRALRLASDTGLPDAIFGRSFVTRWSDRVELNARSEHGVVYLAWSDTRRPSEERLRDADWPGGHQRIEDSVRESLGAAAGLMSLPHAQRVEQVRGHISHNRLQNTRQGNLLRTWVFYTQLPDGIITPRMRARIDQLRADNPETIDFVRAVEAWLSTSFEWTVDIPRPRGEDANLVDQFLFEWRRGHCEYFATAMVVILRAEGIPARIVNGFLGAERNAVGDYYTVRQAHAHSWVEVAFPRAGWVRFEPTPASAFPSDASRFPLVTALAETIDNLRMLWFQWVVEYDMEKQFALAQTVADTLRGERSTRGDGDELTQSLRELGRWALARSRALAWVVAMALVAGAMLRRRARLRHPWGREDHAIVAGWTAVSVAGAIALWPGGAHVAAWVVGGLPPVAGGVFAWLARRALFGALPELGRARRVASQAEISRWMHALVLEAERAGAATGPDVSYRTAITSLALEDPGLAEALEDLVSRYETVRFGGVVLDRDDRRRWQREIREMRARLRRARRARQRRGSS